MPPSRFWRPFNNWPLSWEWRQIQTSFCLRIQVSRNEPKRTSHRDDGWSSRTRGQQRSRMQWCWWPDYWWGTIKPCRRPRKKQPSFSFSTTKLQQGHWSAWWQQQRASDGNTAATSYAMAAPSTTAATGAAGGPAHQIDKPGGIGSKVTACEGGTDEQRASSRHDLSIPGMGCITKETQGGLETTNLSEENGGECSGAHRDEHGGQLGAILSRPADIRGHDAVEADHQHEGGPGVLAPSIPVRVQHMDAHGNQHESSLSEPKQSSSATDPNAEPQTTERQGEGQEEVMVPTERWPRDPLLRERLLDVVAHASLDNPDNWCFANSAITSFLWCTLSLRDFEPSFWGEHCNMLHDFVLSLETGSGNLASEPWFHDVLQCWGRQDRISRQDPISQHDAAGCLMASPQLAFCQHRIYMCDLPVITSLTCLSCCRHQL